MGKNRISAALIERACRAIGARMAHMPLAALYLWHYAAVRAAREDSLPADSVDPVDVRRRARLAARALENTRFTEQMLAWLQERYGMAYICGFLHGYRIKGFGDLVDDARDIEPARYDQGDTDGARARSSLQNASPLWAPESVNLRQALVGAPVDRPARRTG